LKTAIREKPLLEKLIPWKVKALTHIQAQFAEGKENGILPN